MRLALYQLGLEHQHTAPEQPQRTQTQDSQCLRKLARTVTKLADT